MSGPITDAANAINAKTSPAISKFAKLVAAKLEPPAVPAKRLIGIATGAGTGTPTSLTGAALDAYYASVKAVGGNAVRFDCRGLTAQFDTTVKAALLAGLNVLILFPDDPTLAGPCAAKYVPLGVVDYETGNEPNIRGVSPASFLAFNNAAYTAIKKVSQDTKVISAGLAPSGKYADKGNNPVWYLQQTLAAGKLLCDQLGWHPYPYWKGATAAEMLAFHDWSAWSQIADTAPSARSLFDGLIAVTEFGAPTYVDGVSTVDQAGLIGQGIASLKVRPYIGDIYVYSLRDRLELAAAEAHFGIEGKPAGAAFKAAVA